MTLGSRIKQARLAAGMTQQDVADSFGVTRNAVSYWENDKNAPSTLHLRPLADLLNSDFEWLVYGAETSRDENRSNFTQIDDGKNTDIQSVTEKHRKYSGNRKVRDPMTRGFNLAAASDTDVLVYHAILAEPSDQSRVWLSDSFTFDPSPIDRIPCPPNLIATRDLYSFFVIGDSMSPVFSLGDLLLAAPFLPKKIGDTVVAKIRSDDKKAPTYSLKTLAGYQDDDIIFGQINPKKLFKVPRKIVVRMDKVLELKELFGF